MSDALDLDYQTAADRTRATAQAAPPASPSRRVAGTAVVLLFGTMLAVSAVRTQQQKPAAASERDQLVAQIRIRQDRLDAMHTQVSDLEHEVAAAQVRAATRRDVQRQTDAAVGALATVSGAGGATGPGIRIVVDDAPDAAASPDGGVIRDSDLQALVNALWTAGAEAVAINGNRLTSLSAIRFAGRAITVNYRSLRPPYVVEAIGDPQTLPARLLETPGGQAWLGLEQNFGIAFDTESVDTLALPAAPHVELRTAQPLVNR